MTVTLRLFSDEAEGMSRKRENKAYSYKEQLAEVKGGHLEFRRPLLD